MPSHNAPNNSHHKATTDTTPPSPHPYQTLWNEILQTWHLDLPSARLTFHLRAWSAAIAYMHSTKPHCITAPIYNDLAYIGRILPIPEGSRLPAMLFFDLVREAHRQLELTWWQTLPVLYAVMNAVVLAEVIGRLGEEAMLVEGLGDLVIDDEEGERDRELVRALAGCGLEDKRS